MSWVVHLQYAACPPRKYARRCSQNDPWSSCRVKTTAASIAVQQVQALCFEFVSSWFSCRFCSSGLWWGLYWWTFQPPGALIAFSQRERCEPLGCKVDHVRVGWVPVLEFSKLWLCYIHLDSQMLFSNVFQCFFRTTSHLSKDLKRQLLGCGMLRYTVSSILSKSQANPNLQ